MVWCVRARPRLPCLFLPPLPPVHADGRGLLLLADGHHSLAVGTASSFIHYRHAPELDPVTFNAIRLEVEINWAQAAPNKRAKKAARDIVCVRVCDGEGVGVEEERVTRRGRKLATGVNRPTDPQQQPQPPRTRC